MPRRPSDRVKAYVARAASRVAGRLGARRGMLGRAVRALDEELNLEYLAQIAEHEDALIDRIVGGPRAGARMKVSIVVPTYAVAMPYVTELIASVERQTHAHWELCFADDCDPERGVAEYLAGLARARPDRFKYTRHPHNRGIAAATRTGLTLASGDLVAFVDADDLLHRRALEAVVGRFEADDRIDFVYTDHDTTTDLGFRRSPVRKPGFSPELLQSVNYVNHLVVVRKTCLDRCRGAFADETSGSQDWDLCFRLVDVARRVSHVPAVLYHWRARPGSVAGDTYAKPWVHDACIATRQRHLRAIDERLQVVRGESEHRHHYEPGMRPDVELPGVRVVAVSSAGLGMSAPPAVTYRGRLRTLELRHDQAARNGSIVEMLRELCGDDSDELVWVVERARAVPEGDLSKLVAFAIQAPVGAVWPFRAQALALGYTLHARADRLAQLTQPANAFSRFSGNVLTGPLHGLLTRADSLRAALEHLEGVGRADVTFWERPAHLDSVGAGIGLAMLATGRRNVACRGAMCAVALEDALAPRGLAPASDPWV